MAETIEEKVNVGQEKKEEKPLSVLESVVNEAFDAVKAGVNLSIAAAAPVAGYALTGNFGVPVTSVAFVAGTKGKKDSKIIRNESLSGAIFGAFAHYTTLPLKGLSKIGKLAYMIPWVFGANAFYMGEDHLIKEKSPKGLYKKFKENYWPIVKKAFMLPAPINILSALFLPQKYLVAAVAVASYLFRRFVAGGKGEEQTDKTPYLVAASNATAKLAKNVIYSPLKALYEIGSGLYKKTPTPESPKSPTPATAPAH